MGASGLNAGSVSFASPRGRRADFVYRGRVIGAGSGSREIGDNMLVSSWAAG